jgi:uncharacterized protein (DUF1499 family)
MSRKNLDFLKNVKSNVTSFVNSLEFVLNYEAVQKLRHAFRGGKIMTTFVENSIYPF